MHTSNINQLCHLLSFFIIDISPHLLWTNPLLLRTILLVSEDVDNAPNHLYNFSFTFYQIFKLQHLFIYPRSTHSLTSSFTHSSVCIKLLYPIWFTCPQVLGFRVWKTLAPYYWNIVYDRWLNPLPLNNRIEFYCNVTECMGNQLIYRDGLDNIRNTVCMMMITEIW